MAHDLTDHIGVYEGVFPKEECEKLISYFDMIAEKGFAYNRKQQSGSLPRDKKDLSVDLASEYLGELNIRHNVVTIQPALACVWECFGNYADHYSLAGLDQWIIAEGKLQKTKPTEGYHMWHYEQYANRFAAFMIYLNDVESGGETEFLYQKKRIAPTQGTVVIFPASYTHLHRGNPPHSNDKYIFTGWFLTP